MFSATGAGSVIDVSSLESIQGTYNSYQSRQIVEAVDGATVNLSGLKTLTVGGTSVGYGQFEIRTSNGTVRLESLTTVTGSGDGVRFTLDTSASLPELLTATRISLNVGNNQTISLPKLNSLSSSTLTLQGSGRIDGNPDSQLTVTDGSISLADTSVFSLKKLVIDSSATLSGTGTIIGDVENRSTIAPGSASTSGRITIQGNYTQASGGKLVVDLAGNNPGTTYDQLEVSGTANLNGGLQVVQKSGYNPTSGTVFQPVVSQSRSGAFSATSGLTLASGSTLTVVYTSDKVVLTVSGNGEGEPYVYSVYGPMWTMASDAFEYPLYGPVWMPLVAEGEANGEGGSDPASPPVTLPEEWQYDTAFNQLLSYSDGNGNLTLYTLDSANGNRISSRRVIGQVDSTQNGETDDLVTTFTYTTFGLIDKVTDPLGRITDYDYDAVGRMVKLTEAAGTTIATFETYEYDLYGNMTARVDARSFRSTMEYDVMNRMTKMTSPDPDGDGPLIASSTLFEYNAFGQLLRTVDARGSESTMTYDAMGRMETQTNDAGKIARNSYDLAGNRIAVTDSNGNTTRYKYDARKRMTESTAADGGVTRYEYDLANNLTSLTDPVGNRTQFRYDSRNRMIEEIDPLGKSILYEYDGVGKIATKTDRNNRTTSFEYDDANRLVKETWRNADYTTANIITYSYDKAGNLLGVQDQASKLSYKYDALSRPIEVTNAGTPSAPLVELDYEFDPVGNIETVTDTIFGSLAGTTSYTYDGQNRMSSVSQGGISVDPKLVDFVYNELGQFSQIDRHNDLQRSSLVARSRYSYDDLNRLTALTHGSVTSPRSLAFYDYEYDAADRIIAITDTVGRTDFRRDATNQATAVSRGNSDPRGSETYRYDRNGNRTSSHLAASYTTGVGNKLMSDGTYEYTYDGEGNLILRTETQSGTYRVFDYDHRNRMVRVTDRSTGGVALKQVEMIYDAGDRRISQTVDADGAASGLATTEHYIYDGEHIILEFIDADGPGSAAQPISKVRNLFGPVIDMILAQEQISTGETNWVLTDHLGTIRDLIGNMGQQVLDLQYDSFGNLRSSSSPTTVTRYGFTGREFDNSLGLYYYRARYYSPELGRFLQEDPIAYTAQDANLYRYVFNQPAEHTDPSGRILPLILAGIWAGAEVGLAIYDSYDTASTIMDPCASTGEKFVAGGLWAAGAILPGGGYSQIDNVAKGVAKNVVTAGGPTTVIGRVKDLQNLAPGEQSLLSRLPDLGSPKANWKQNSGVLRQEINRGLPIRDASVGDTAGQFLNAERNLLRDRGWIFDSNTSFWNPPR
jgi:RHS repeat-associated protein